MPQGGAVKQGKAEFTDEGKLLKIRASDKAILHFDSFDIGTDEVVEFIQPKETSSILSRINDNNPSSILGKLQSNGRIFLLNPYGIYFGRDAQVNVGSFIATTLEINDHDFMQEEFAFFAKIHGKIINEGILKASQEGAIVLLASQVENLGTIIADVGKVIIASTEIATLDFSGDGLISFAVEQPMLDQKTHFDLKEAGCVVKNVVNTEGIVEGTDLFEEKGVIRLGSKSQIRGQDISIKGDKVFVEGSLVSTNDLTINADHLISLRDQERKPLHFHARGDAVLNSKVIDILVWQNAYTSFSCGRDIIFVSDHPISADGRFFAGRNVAFITSNNSLAPFTSFFDPIITAAGSVSFGSYSGPSLKVEAGGNITSTGNITITGPDSMVCNPPGCGSDPDCTTLSSEPALILIAGAVPSSPSCNPVPLTIGSTTFNSVSGTGSTISLQGIISGSPSNLTVVTLQGNIVLTGATTISSETGITITGSVDGAFPLTLYGGTGTITVTGPIGSTTELTSINVDSITSSAPFPALSINNMAATGNIGLSASPVYLGGNISSQSGSVSILGDVIVTVNTSVIDVASGNITISGAINGNSSGKSLGLFANAGTITFGNNVGNTVPLKTLIAEATAITFQGNLYNAQKQEYKANGFNFTAPALVTLQSASPGITFEQGAIQLSGGSNFLVETNGGSFSFFSLSASSSQNMNILAGNGTVTLGQITLLSNLLVNAGQIFLSGPLTLNDLALNSNTSITNLNTPFVIATTANAIFNALGGTVGTIESPIAVDASWIVIAGAPQKLAAFSGTTDDGTIHPLPNNFPCPLIFNGITLINCPSVPPFPNIPARDFYVPGIYSQYNSLASDYYFFPEVIDPSYIKVRDVPFYWTQKQYTKIKSIKRFLPVKEKVNYRT